MRLNKSTIFKKEFSQEVLINALALRGIPFGSRGVCFAAAILYAVYGKNVSDNKVEIDPISKIIKKLNSPETREELLKLTILYQTQLQLGVRQHPIELEEFNNEPLKECLPLGCTEREIIGLSLVNDNVGHEMVVKIIREQGKEDNYVLFDPNFGETAVLNEKELKEVIKTLVKNCYANSKYINFSDYEEVINRYNLNGKEKREVEFKFFHFVENMEQFEFLVRAGVTDINGRAGYQFTALHYAVNSNNSFLFNLLIEKGADVNCISIHRVTPLHLAVQCGNKHFVDVLVSSGAKVDFKNREKIAPLDLAYEKGDKKIIQLLVRPKLIEAIRKEDEAAICQSIEQGAGIDLLTKEGWNTLFKVSKISGIFSAIRLADNITPLPLTSPVMLVGYSILPAALYSTILPLFIVEVLLVSILLKDYLPAIFKSSIFNSLDRKSYFTKEISSNERESGMEIGS